MGKSINTIRDRFRFAVKCILQQRKVKVWDLLCIQRGVNKQPGRERNLLTHIQLTTFFSRKCTVNCITCCSGLKFGSDFIFSGTCPARCVMMLWCSEPLMHGYHPTLSWLLPQSNWQMVYTQGIRIELLRFSLKYDLYKFANQSESTRLSNICQFLKNLIISFNLLGINVLWNLI